MFLFHYDRNIETVSIVTLETPRQHLPRALDMSNEDDSATEAECVVGGAWAGVSNVGCKITSFTFYSMWELMAMEHNTLL